MSVKAVSPRLLAEFVRAPEDVVVIYELGLVGLYAGLSKLFRRHKVVSLVEGDYRHIGRTGSARLKVAVRRFAARFVDVFVANNPPARDYLVRTLNVDVDKIVVGWWLAGFPATLVARPPRAPAARDGAPLFVSAGRLIPQKGVDLLIRALATYRREFGPCALWVIGDGRERDALIELATRLGVREEVSFLGTVDHETLKGAFATCSAFVFPTLQDFVGRVAVEALSAGAPIVISPMTGAVGTIVQDGVNGIVVDPRDPRALAEAMRRAADPQTSRVLREGVQRLNGPLLPDAAAEVILGAIALARDGSAPPGQGRTTANSSTSTTPGAGVADNRGSRAAGARSPCRRARRGAQPGRDPGDARRAGGAGVASVHARDAAVLRPAVPGGEAGAQAVRHDHLDRHVPHAQHGPPGRVALRRAGARRLPGRLQHVLEGGVAAQGAGQRAGTGARAAMDARDAVGGDAQDCPTASTPATSGTPVRRPSCYGRRLNASRPGTVGSTCGTSASDNVGALAMVRTIAVGLFNEYQDASRRLAARAAAAA